MSSDVILSNLFIWLFFFRFLGLHLWHMGVPRLGIQLELQLPAYTTATATSDLSHVCDLHHSTQQHRIPNPLSEARDWTCNLMVPNRIHFHCTTMGTPLTTSFTSNMSQMEWFYIINSFASISSSFSTLSISFHLYTMYFTGFWSISGTIKNIDC